MKYQTLIKDTSQVLGIQYGCSDATAVLSLWGSNDETWEPLDKESENQGGCRLLFFYLCCKHIYVYTSTRCIFVDWK